MFGSQNDHFTTISDMYFESLEKQYIKKNGIAYTPEWLSQHITQQAFKQWEKFNRGLNPKLVGDICCGTGVFIEKLLSMIIQSGMDTKINGFDIDPGAISIAQQFFNHSKENIQLEVKDTLRYPNALSNEKKELYDIIVGNPPYVSHQILDPDHKKFLRDNYFSARSGVFDLSIVFVEEILNCLKINGVASLILSNKFMTSKYGKHICEILASKCNVIRIEDFNDLQLFKKLTTYTCIITFIKNKPARRHTLCRALYEARRSFDSMPKMIEETIAHEQLQKHPWNFHTKEEASVLKKLNSKQSRPIYDIFDGVQQGLRTGANDVFIIDNETQKFLESSYIQKFISGENVVGLTIKNSDQYIIYPYDYSQGVMSPILESTLEREQPKLYKYLLLKKDILEARSLQGSSSWFEFSRSQSLSVLYKAKIFVREMMPSALFSADVNGEYAFSSGYALLCDSMSEDDIIAWAAILSTRVMEFSMRHVGTQLHSGWFRLMKNHLEALRLPNLTDRQYKNIKMIVCKNDSEMMSKINHIIAECFSLTNAEEAYISEVLDKIHLTSMPDKRISNRKNDDTYEPVKLELYNKKLIERDDLRKEVTFSQNKKQPIHNWYKYTQGFSSTLVHILLDEFEVSNKSLVLDPFSGCGTTTLTCAYRGVKSIGIDISPLMCEVTRIKCRSWNLEKIRKSLHSKVLSGKKSNLSEKSLIFTEYFEKAYSDKILDKLLILSSNIKQISDPEIRDFYTMGLLSILEDVSKIRKHGSHYRFLDNSSSVGLQKLNIQVVDENANIKDILLARLQSMYEDVRATGGKPAGSVTVLNQSSLATSIDSMSVDFIITSPPYLNRNNYIAQQKAELDILGLIKDKIEYRELVKSTFRSHTDSNLSSGCVSSFEEVNTIIKNIELMEGNNPKIPYMICGYFDDIKASLIECHRVLKRKGRASFVVGNTRWGGVVVPIDYMLAKIAEDNGFYVASIFVTRMKGNSPQQMKKYGKIPVRESIVNIVKN